MNLSRRGLLLAAPAVILTPGLLMRMRNFAPRRNPLQAIAFSVPGLGIYVGNLKYFPRRLTDEELIVATSQHPITVDLSRKRWINGARIDFTVYPPRVT